MLIFQIAGSVVGITIGILAFLNREWLSRKFSEKASPKAVARGGNSPAWVGFCGVGFVVINGIILLNGLSKLL